MTVTDFSFLQVNKPFRRDSILNIYYLLVSNEAEP